MESFSRNSPTPLTRLIATPGAFDFFQAVLMIEQSKTLNSCDKTEKMLFFSPHNDGSYPSRVIHNYDPQQSILFCNILNIAGYDGILTADNYELICKKNSTLPFLLKLFYHRCMTLFYLAWQHSKLYINFNRHQYHQYEEKRLNQILCALIGCEPQTIFEERLLFYSGILSRKIKSAAQINLLLSHFFNVAFNVIPFQGNWIELDSDQTTKIAQNGKFNSLGNNCILGRRMWSLQNHCRIELGPLSFNQFAEWLPQKNNMKRLRKLLKMCISPEIKVMFFIILNKNEVPSLQLHSNSTTQLGWNAWVKSQQFNYDAYIPVANDF